MEVILRYLDSQLDQSQIELCNELLMLILRLRLTASRDSVVVVYLS